MAESRSDGFKPALSFDALTGLFDPVVAIASREGAFKRRVLERAAIGPGEAVLDLGCGTGTLALLAWEGQPAAELTGLDADPAILARARSKADVAGAPIRFDRGMADDLPYADASFDVVLSTLFLHHLGNDAKGATVAEVARVLKPGGRLVLADYGRAQDPLMRAVFALTVRMLDGRETTELNAAGGVPAALEAGGLTSVAVTDRLRTPTGTIEIVTGRR